MAADVGHERRREGERSVEHRGRWLPENDNWVFDVEAADGTIDTPTQYSLSGEAHQIDGPTLILAGVDDHSVPVQHAEEYGDEIGDRATVDGFETETGAGEHCQSGNLSLAGGVIYARLDDHVGVVAS